MCDVESLHLPAAARRARLHPEGEVLARAPEILEHSRRIGAALRPLRRRAVPDRRSTEMRWDEDDRALDRRDRPRRPHQGALRRHGQRPAAPARSCPASPASTSFKGHTLPHQPLGLRLHRRRRRRRPDQARRQARRHHRHRRHGHPVRPAPRRVRPSSSTSSSARRRRSTCATTGRPTRSGRRRSSPAGSSERMDNFNILVSGGVRRTRTWSTTAGPTSSATCWHAAQAAAKLGRRLDAGEPRELMELADYREDEPGPRPRRRDRQGPGDRRGAEALVPPVLQAAVLPRRIPRHLQPPERHTSSTPTGQGVERITEHGVVVDGVEYEVDCLIFATGFEVGTAYTRRAGYDIIGRDGMTLSRALGRRRCARCTACTPTASRTASSSDAPVGQSDQLPAHARRAGQHVAYIIDQVRKRGAQDAGADGSRPRQPGSTRSSGGAAAGRPISPNARPAITTMKGCSIRSPPEQPILARADRLFAVARALAQGRQSRRA